jgi:hypothetical protein
MACAQVQNRQKLSFISLDIEISLEDCDCLFKATLFPCSEWHGHVSWPDHPFLPPYITFSVSIKYFSSKGICELGSTNAHSAPN